MYQMLVLDLDGTTLLHSGGIAEIDQKAVRLLLDKGIFVTIATGRLFSGSLLYAKQLGLTGEIACMNGAEIVDIQTQKRSVEQTLDSRTLAIVQKVLLENGTPTFVFAHDNVIHDKKGTPYLRYIQLWSRSLYYVENVFSSHSWQKENRIMAVGTIGSIHAMKSMAAKLQTELPKYIRVITFPFLDNSRHFLMIFDKRKTKGTALRHIAKTHNIAIEKTVAIGDWINDIPMFNVAGRSYLMGIHKNNQWHPSEKILNSVDKVLDAPAGFGGGIAEVARLVWNIRV